MITKKWLDHQISGAKLIYIYTKVVKVCIFGAYNLNIFTLNSYEKMNVNTYLSATNKYAPELSNNVTKNIAKM